MLAFPLSQRAAARYALDATWSHRSRVPTVELSRGLGCTCWLQAGVLECSSGMVLCRLQVGKPLFCGIQSFTSHQES
jgi:hypothetical protein